MDRRLDLTDALDNPILEIAYDAPRSGVAAQQALVRELKPFLAAVIDIGEPQQMRGHLSGRIVTTIFALGVDTRDPEIGNPLGIVRIEMPADIKKLTVC